MTPNPDGRYVLEPLGIELGIWHGWYKNQEQDWLRWWDLHGRMLPIGKEEAKQERDRAEREKQRAERAEEERTQAQEEIVRLKERLRSAGLDPNGL